MAETNAKEEEENKSKSFKSFTSNSNSKSIFKEILKWTLIAFGVILFVISQIYIYSYVQVKYNYQLAAKQANL